MIAFIYKWAIQHNIFRLLLLDWSVKNKKLEIGYLLLNKIQFWMDYEFSELINLNKSKKSHLIYVLVEKGSVG